MPQPDTSLSAIDHMRIGLELAYMALPLLIYVLFFLVVVPGKDWAELWHKPEWMFIALLYMAESLRDSVEAYGNEAGTKSGALQMALVLNILLFVITAVVLFAVLGAYEGACKGSPHVYAVQWGCLSGSIVFCWQQKTYNRKLELRARTT
jgi:hypothetical protein